MKKQAFIKFFKDKHKYYPIFMILSLIFIINFRGCKDFEDCRSIYTNVAIVKFKGTDKLVVDELEYIEPNKKPPYTKTSSSLLNNLQDKTLRIFLHPKHNKISLLFHINSTEPDYEPDTLTILYKRIPSLISPYCGIQQEYIIEDIETTFKGSKIINDALRSEEEKKYNSKQEETHNVEIYY